MQMIHGMGGWEKLNTIGAMQMIIRDYVKCGMRNMNCEIQSAKCKV